MPFLERNSQDCDQGYSEMMVLSQTLCQEHISFLLLLLLLCDFGSKNLCCWKSIKTSYKALFLFIGSHVMLIYLHIYIITVYLSLQVVIVYCEAYRVVLEKLMHLHCFNAELNIDTEKRSSSVMVQKSWMQSRKVVGPQTTKLSC
jgi:predicted membrane protein